MDCKDTPPCGKCGEKGHPTKHCKKIFETPAEKQERLENLAVNKGKRNAKRFGGPNRLGDTNPLEGTNPLGKPNAKRFGGPNRLGHTNPLEGTNRFSVSMVAPQHDDPTWFLIPQEVREVRFELYIHGFNL
jgi:hypothetical protein